jgi:hypothetical protein
MSDAPVAWRCTWRVYPDRIGPKVSSRATKDATVSTVHRTQEEALREQERARLLHSDKPAGCFVSSVAPIFLKPPKRAPRISEVRFVTPIRLGGSE